ncbi:hypothetical protein B0H10DRAFT_1959283 [Mycena sp. CBHHK59/15]|nr:hypothetical protein B0H10DRAFT_1959283 [Mycena sp. CBHHK59/15]
MSEHQQSKPPIYAALLPELPLADTPSELEAHISTMWRTAMGTVGDAHVCAQALIDCWVGIEHAVQARLHTICVPCERLMPGVLTTTANVSAYLGVLEEQHFPAVVEVHTVGNAVHKAEETVHKVEETVHKVEADAT